KRKPPAARSARRCDLLHAGPERERHRVDAEAPDGRLPHLVGRRAEDEIRIGRCREPRRVRELRVELARAPARVAPQQPRARARALPGTALEEPAQARQGRGEMEALADALGLAAAGIGAEQEEAAMLLDRSAGPEPHPAVAAERWVERDGLGRACRRRT